jgi:hypothetical protein
MSRRDDEGFEINFPFGRFYAGGRGFRFAGDEEDVIEMDETSSGDYWEVRRSVRKRLRFLRHAFTYVALNGFFVLIDWLSGGGGSGVNWAQWVALIWGTFLAWEFAGTFVAPNLWGREMEERLIQRELRRRRGS